MKVGDSVVCIKGGHDEIGSISIDYHRRDRAIIVGIIWNGHFLSLAHKKRGIKKDKHGKIEPNGLGADIRKWRKTNVSL